MEHIKEHIDDRLWEFIKRSYNSEDYKTAILDSIQFIGDVIREKSGLDSDGNPLIGSAFGGTNPKIKLNKLKTESEKNIQKGIESILRGIYSAYRNPRSHSKVKDTEEGAFEIIVFINHLLKLIDKSKGKFAIELFLQRVFDKSFVQDKKYAELLIKDIPKNKLFEVAIEIFRQKETGRIHNLQYIWDSLNTHLTVEEKQEITALASEELRYTDSLKIVIRCISLFKTNWKDIEEDARLRAENKLIQLIPDAETDYHGQTNDEGIFVSWFISLIEVSSLKKEIADKIYEALDSDDEEKQRFIIDHFGYKIDYLEEHLFLRSFEELFKQKLKRGNRLIYNWVSKYYASSNGDSKYKKELDSFLEERPADDLPF